MLNFNDTTFVTHIRVDSPERIANYMAVVSFLRKNAEGMQFVLMEDDASPNPLLADKMTGFLSDNDIHICMENKMPYRRPFCYNIGANLTDRPVLCFMDTDVLVHPLSLNMARQCIHDKTFDVMYPYNGGAIYLKEQGRNAFLQVPCIDTLLAMLPPPGKMQLFAESQFMRVEHLNAKGAIVLMHRETFDRTGGFNIDFVDWGYEDDEFEIRQRKYNSRIGRCLASHEVFYHLWHPRTQANASKNPNHPYLNSNMGILQSVREADLPTLDAWMTTQKQVIANMMKARNA